MKKTENKQQDSPITKTVFLDAFKNTKKHIRNNYIKQEVFLYNVVEAMNAAYLDLQNNAYSLGTSKVGLTSISNGIVPMSSALLQKKSEITIEAFDDNAFKRNVIGVLAAYDPIKWGCFDLQSKTQEIDQKLATAKSYDYAAATDVLGVVLTAAGGKFVKSVAGKLTQNGLRSAAKAVSRTLGGRPFYRMGSVKGAHLDVFTNGRLKFSVNGKFPIETPGIIPLFANKFYNDKTDEFHQEHFSGERFSYGDTINEYTDRAKKFLPFEEDTKNQISIGTAMFFDYITDFMPVVGNAKSYISFRVNSSIADTIREDARDMRVAMSQEYSEKNEWIRETVLVEIKKDLYSFDKKTMYKMMKYALTQNKKK